MTTTARVHCELGPVLVNRTAVYKMCCALPRELRQRGFEVTSSALLAKVAGDRAEPQNSFEKQLYSFSQKAIALALRRPGLFNKARRAAGWVTSCRHSAALKLFMDPFYTLFYGAPQRGICIVYDITTVTEPEWHPGGVGQLYNAAFRLLATSQMQIVTSCKNTADQMRVNWGIAPSRLTVLPLGLFSFPTAELVSNNGAGSEPPFFLFVGSLEPRKNVDGLIRAYVAADIFKKTGIRLRIIGALPAEGHPTLTLARGTPGVDLKGFASDAEVASSYHNCMAFVYPSYCEGFGLPLLEAMHTGAVCLSTITGASPEIAGDAALYVNPYNPHEIAAGLLRITQLSAAQRAEMSRQARQRAALFRWSHFYDGLAELLKREAART